jgi:hypothetical protein
MKNQKLIFIICLVRLADDSIRKKLEDYVKLLENDGNTVHLPHRDTNQNKSGFEICLQNASIIELADEVHIFYSKKSQGIHFDLGVSFAMNKKIVIVENEDDDLKIEGKSFAKMLVEWTNKIKEYEDNNY